MKADNLEGDKCVIGDRIKKRKFNEEIIKEDFINPKNYKKHCDN